MFWDELSEFMKILQSVHGFLEGSASLLYGVRMVVFEHLQAGHYVNPEAQKVPSQG